VREGGWASHTVGVDIHLTSASSTTHLQKGAIQPRNGDL
jgi:hypothetical protein